MKKTKQNSDQNIEQNFELVFERYGEVTGIFFVPAKCFTHALLIARQIFYGSEGGWNNKAMRIFHRVILTENLAEYLTVLKPAAKEFRSHTGKVAYWAPLREGA